MALNNLATSTSWRSSYWSSYFLLMCQSCQCWLVCCQLWLSRGTDHSLSLLLLWVWDGLVLYISSSSSVSVGRGISSVTPNVWPWAVPLVNGIVLPIIYWLSLGQRSSGLDGIELGLRLVWWGWSWLANRWSLLVRHVWEKLWGICFTLNELLLNWL